MQQLAIVYFPRIPGDEINNFRRKYDPGWQIIPPHITIVTPFSEIPESQLIEHIEATTTNIASFPIHITGLTKSFDDYLFLLVKEGAERLANLHKRLYSGILSPYLPTELPFVPHITLGFFKTRDMKFAETEFIQAYAEAAELHFDIRCDLDTLSIIKGDGLSPATIVKTISFLKN